MLVSAPKRRGGRVAEGARLESVYAGNRIEGSNPSLSATILLTTVSLRSGFCQNSQLLHPFLSEAVDPLLIQNHRNLSLMANSLSSC